MADMMTDHMLSVDHESHTIIASAVASSMHIDDPISLAIVDKKAGQFSSKKTRF